MFHLFKVLFIPFHSFSGCCGGVPLLLVSGQSQAPVASCPSLPAPSIPGIKGPSMSKSLLLKSGPKSQQVLLYNCISESFRNMYTKIHRRIPWGHWSAFRVCMAARCSSLSAASCGWMLQSSSHTHWIVEYTKLLQRHGMYQYDLST